MAHERGCFAGATGAVGTFAVRVGEAAVVATPLARIGRFFGGVHFTVRTGAIGVAGARRRGRSGSDGNQEKGEHVVGHCSR